MKIFEKKTTILYSDVATTSVLQRSVSLGHHPPSSTTGHTPLLQPVVDNVTVTDLSPPGHSFQQQPVGVAGTSGQPGQPNDPGQCQRLSNGDQDDCHVR